MIGVGYATFYGLNTLPTIYGGARKGIKESDYDAIDAGLKIDFTHEIFFLNEGIEISEAIETVGGWLKHDKNIRATYSLVTRPFDHTGDIDTETFSTALVRYRTLLSQYKYLFIKVSDYFYSVNTSILGDVLLFPIAIESVEIETQAGIKTFTVNIKHAQLNNL